MNLGKRRNILDRLTQIGAVHFIDGGDGGAGGGGDGGGSEPSLEQIKKDMDLLRAERDTLANKNKEILGEVKSARENLKKWDGLDPENVRGLMDRLQNDEELRLLSEGKHDEVIKRRTEKVESKYQAELKKLQDAIADRDEKLSRAQVRERDLVINNSVISEFRKEQGLEGASEDVVLRAQRIFTVEDGEAIARDKNGTIVQGKDGPLTIKEWVAELKESAAHLFEGSQGAGVRGNSGSGGSDLDRKLDAAYARGDTAAVRKIKESIRERQKREGA